MKKLFLCLLASARLYAMESSISLRTNSLSEIYTASKTWTKCISRDEKHIACILKSQNRHNVDCKGCGDHVNNPTNLTADEFLQLISEFKDSFKGENKPISEEKFSPFLERYVFNKKTEIHCLSDLHADPHTLLEHLMDLKNKGIIDDQFKIVGENNYLAILGDCGDTGDSSCEVWALLLRLRIENKNKCILVRGNHETLGLAGQQGFGNELEKKFKLREKLVELQKNNPKASIQTFTKPFYSFFNYLPDAVFVGYHHGKEDHIKYACLSHAGIEYGLQKHAELLAKTQQGSMPLEWNREEVLRKNKVIKKEVDKAYAKIDSDQKREETRALQSTDVDLEYGTPQQSGFMWIYYSADDDSYYRRGLVYGKILTQAVFKSWSNNTWGNWLKKYANRVSISLIGKRLFDATTYSVITNIRGHQHVMPESFKDKQNIALEIKDMYLYPSGVFKQWANNMRIASQWQIEPYSVFTLKNAVCNVYGYPVPVNDNNDKYLWYDNIGSRAQLLIDEGDWQLQSTNLTIFNESELPKHMQSKTIGLKTYLNLD